MATTPVPAADLAAFVARLRRDAALDDADLDAVVPHARIREIARGGHLLRPGDVATECGMVVTGLIREHFPLADGREVTRGFAGPGDYVGSLSDLLGGAPARSAVVAEAATRVVVTPWAVIAGAAAARPAWAALVHGVVARLYLAKAEREYELLALDAEGRYQRFLDRHAGLEPEIAQRHVASYVGITPEHLSRLRRRRRELAAGAGPPGPGRSRGRSRSSG
jgi:CRP-like cAMP-binding protein